MRFKPRDIFCQCPDNCKCLQEEQEKWERELVKSHDSLEAKLAVAVEALEKIRNGGCAHCDRNEWAYEALEKIKAK